ncbi:MAG: hypothetical protein QGD93_02635 [Actinomycetota bacterium]|nr:hypothetical protein [Actinomycetota bacterium]
MEILRGLPWKWIIPVILIAALAFAARSYAGALGRADAADALTIKLADRLAEEGDSTETLEHALADADSDKAALARVNAARIAALALENEELERTVRDLAAADRRNAEGVDVALTALAAMLAPEAMPALRKLTGAYETRITGLSDQLVALAGIVELRDERIEILEGELAAERFARGLADGVSSGLRGELVTQAEIVDSQAVEIDELRDAVAPGFFKRLGQNAGLAAGASAFGAAVVFLATSGG